MPKGFKFTVRSKTAPVVTIDSVADAVYVYFQPGAKVAETKVTQEWPLIAVDLDARGEVIGIEALSADNLSIRELAQEAAVKIPRRLVDAAQYRSVVRDLAVA